MTREEQLYWLCRLRRNIQCYTDVATLPDDVRKSFVQVLAEVIEQQPCDTENCKIVKALIGDPCKVKEPCTDAVSREAVDEIKELMTDINGDTVYAVRMSDIRQLPSVPQKPIECEDAISRILTRMWNCRGKHTTSIDKVKMEQIIRDELPSVTQKSGWIPVSERLPEEAFGCLVTILDTDLRTQDEFENILPYFVGYDGETWNNFCGEPIPFEVIAWMPLPKPYEPQESEEV